MRWAVSWGTVLQAGRSQVRFPILSLEFLIDIILPVALWVLGSTQPLTNEYLRGKGGRCVGLTTLPPSCSQFSTNLWASAYRSSTEGLSVMTIAAVHAANRVRSWTQWRDWLWKSAIQNSRFVFWVGVVSIGNVREWLRIQSSDSHRDRIFFFNPLALELDICSLAHHLCNMWIFYEPRRVTLGNTRHFVEE